MLKYCAYLSFTVAKKHAINLSTRGHYRTAQCQASQRRPVRGLSQKIKQQLETVQAVAVVFENVNLRLESEIKINGAE